MPTKNQIYLDNAATTALDPRVLEAMTPYLETYFGNPSAVHSHGRQVRTAIEKARKQVAGLLNVTAGEIFFTSGGTEADNTIIHGAVQSLGLKQIITSPIEHHAVLHAAEKCAQLNSIPLRLLEVDQNGNLDYNQLTQWLEKEPDSLVTLMHGNNEIGNLIELKSISEICQEKGAFFHSDTVQTMGHYQHDLQSLQVQSIVGSAHKFHGPKGVGFLYIKKPHKIHPLLVGGSQERNMRGGTENVYGIVGLAKALSLAYEEMDSHKTQILGLKKLFIEKLSKALPEVSFNGASGDLEHSLYTVLNVCLPASKKNEGMLLFNLDLHGISASGGSACSSGATLGSHVLRALDSSAERESVRFSFSRYNTTSEIEEVVKVLSELYLEKL
ncbi:cysteine desulfurase family protein [Pleomorphovibrio marinus]|uniref:cysteine desulfurase family protein n=1 Tax=Pleomorphovibrio marinus TaxID=2164132 RepID=UPI000E0B619A|nr:cysteine desulfurase family protein [Pleomorphovibrio marinus]